MHEILIRAPEGGGLEIRCACGVFLLDRHPGTSGFAQASLVEITNIVTAHYAHVAHPERGNGSTKLIKGKKLCGSG